MLNELKALKFYVLVFIVFKEKVCSKTLKKIKMNSKVHVFKQSFQTNTAWKVVYNQTQKQVILKKTYRNRQFNQKYFYYLGTGLFTHGVWRSRLWLCGLRQCFCWSAYCQVHRKQLKTCCFKYDWNFVSKNDI